MSFRSAQNGVESSTRARIGVRTLRTDRWWRAPLLTVALLTIWLAYGRVRISIQRDYFVERYHLRLVPVWL